MRGKGERLRWSGRRAGAMKREAKAKPPVEGKGPPPRRAYDTDSSRRQSDFVCADKEKGKEKLEEDEAAAASTMAVSASLMPPIWDKTIPYDGESFHLEYMDLDEFLLENGIPAGPTHLAQNLLLPVAELEGKESASSSTASPPSSSAAVFQPSETVSSTESSLKKERETPSPIDPNCVEVDVNFNPDPADLVLSSVPGGELFNPRKHKFAEEDLKPQPMIKKAKKVFVPDEQKDEKYWTRRKKNNVAAKRSRDARRLKENQITIRAAFLEKENTALRTEVAELRKEVGKCKTIVSKYETKYGPL
ncbi:thyrotroph embryonic factor isoform X3 [Equus asinus]|uniref:TEF transcription factor, PAR bZIP family member n=1 Tax=Equus asinus TaxID=9793 RepID=A0A9L0K4R6_EQUAS|nr:thyrotroph embryonic factor isoform X3 [Equus caballus]XP_044635026.1 thyrotroph embryonic factor isoform X2 [Equus asinus]XP_046502105.1 thyrotroph embryonic factor isoform X3 [Equus quagga]